MLGIAGLMLGVVGFWWILGAFFACVDLLWLITVLSLPVAVAYIFPLGLVLIGDHPARLSAAWFPSGFALGALIEFGVISVWDTLLLVFLCVALGLYGIGIGGAATGVRIRRHGHRRPGEPCCPHCGYILYYATEHRCPECGRGFSIAEIDMSRAIVDEHGRLRPKAEKPATPSDGGRPGRGIRRAACWLLRIAGLIAGGYAFWWADEVLYNSPDFWGVVKAVLWPFAAAYVLGLVLCLISGRSVRSSAAWFAGGFVLAALSAFEFILVEAVSPLAFFCIALALYGVGIAGGATGVRIRKNSGAASTGPPCAR